MDHTSDIYCSSTRLHVQLIFPSLSPQHKENNDSKDEKESTEKKDSGHRAAHEAAHEAATKAAGAAGAAHEAAAGAAGAAGAAAAAAAMAGHFNEHGYHYLRDIGNLVAQALDPLGVDVQVCSQNSNSSEFVIFLGVWRLRLVENCTLLSYSGQEVANLHPDSRNLAAPIPCLVNIYNFTQIGGHRARWQDRNGC